MADSADSSVSVTGNLNDLTIEDFELFFESRRFCPSGGEVKEVLWVSKNCVKVTFHDCKVVGRLERHMTMRDEHHITVEPFVDGKYQTEDEIKPTKMDSDLASFTSWEPSIDRSPCSGRYSSDSDDSLWDHTTTSVVSDSVRPEQSKTEDAVSLKSSLGIDTNLEDDFGSVNMDNENSISFSRRNIDLYVRKTSNPADMFTRSTSFANRRSTSQPDNFFRSVRKSASHGKIHQDSKRETVSPSRSEKHWKTESQNPAAKSNIASRGMLKHWNSADLFSSKQNETFDDVKTFGRVDVNSKSFGDKFSRGDSKLIEVVSEENSDSDGEVERLSRSRIRGKQEDSVPFPRNIVTENLSFNSEKLKLIKMVIDSNDDADDVVSKCTLNFDEHQQLITIEGSDESVISAKFHLHEIALFTVNGRVKIPPQAHKLLQSSKGKEWITKEFANQNLLSVFYTKDGTGYVLSADDSMLQSTCDFVEKIVVCQSIAFDDGAMTFFQSSTWANKVTSFESSSLISVDTDYSQKVVTVAGCAADVSTCCFEVKKLMKANSKITHPIKHKVGVVRLLRSLAHSITDDIHQNLSSKVQLEFDPPKGVISVTGRQDDVETAVSLLQKNYLNAICYDKYEVNKQGLTLEMFTKKSNPGSDLIDLLELRNKCIIEVRGNSNRTADASHSFSNFAAEKVEVKPAKRRRNGIQIKQGSIVDFEADVLVNTIANRTLERGGVVNQCFLRAGGSKLYMELKRSFPQDFGRDVLMTSAGGKIRADCIFHAAIRKYRNQDSLDRLYNTVKKCLEMADRQNARSIAFPTLGCGKLGYAPKDVADCFSQALKHTRTNLQISIVAFEEHLVKEFRSHFNQDHSEGSSDNESKDNSWFGGRLRRFFGGFSNSKKMPVDNQIVFHINALSNDVVSLVRSALAARISEMVTESPIKDEAIGELDDEAMFKIEALQTPEIEIKIDRARQIITVKGIKSQVEQVKLKVLHLVYKEGARNERPGHFQSQNSLRFPRHWSLHKRGNQMTSECNLTELSANDHGEIYADVLNLVMKTWEPNKVGHGSDAAGLAHKQIKVRKISCVENASLYRKYMSRREELRLGASINSCPLIKGLQGEKQIMTLNLGLKKLDSFLAHNINECYLLHGTKDNILTSIKHTGLDSRMSGSHVLFGQGAYLTESSTKADQYSDSKQQRKLPGSPLYMYVCRVLLGNAFVCQTPKQFKRPPCLQCHSDVCSSTSHPYAGMFDSVIGTHKAPSTRLLFREFVIYHPEQSYPEFLVEYERV